MSVGPGRSELPPSSEVVVVGGGVIGCSIAYQLARRGVQVTVLEQESLAWGASGRNGGMVGQESGYIRGVLGPYTMASRRIMDAWEDELGCDFHFRRSGGYRLYTDAAEFTALGSQAPEPGAPPSELVDGDEVRRRLPVVGPAVVGAAYFPARAHCYPFPLVYGLAAAASRIGASVREGVRVTGIRQRAGTVTHVVTDHGPIRARWVVNAANAWAAEVGVMAGVALPIAPQRGQVLVTAPLPPLLPATLAYWVGGSNMYWRQAPGGQLVIGGGRSIDAARNGPSFSRRVSPPIVRFFTESVLRVAPSLATTQVVRIWAGTMGFTPDHRPIVGEVAAPRGFVVAAGFCGSGLGWAAIVGRLVAQHIAGEPLDLPFDPVSPDRFLTPARAA